jgi:hypothetical protein
MTEHALWVNVGAGQERPDWVWVIVTFRDGRPDFSVQPRWATEGDVWSKGAPDGRSSTVANSR